MTSLDEQFDGSRRSLRDWSPKSLTFFGAFVFIGFFMWHAEFAAKRSPDDISVHEAEAFEWIAENTTADVRSIVVGRGNFLEWAPTLMQRDVLNEVYGAEWRPELRQRLLPLNDELLACDVVDCMATLVGDAFGTGSYLLVVSLDDVGFTTRDTSAIYSNSAVVVDLVEAG